MEESYAFCVSVEPRLCDEKEKGSVSLTRLRDMEEGYASRVSAEARLRDMEEGYASRVSAKARLRDIEEGYVF